MTLFKKAILISTVLSTVVVVSPFIAFAFDFDPVFESATVVSSGSNEYLSCHAQIGDGTHIISYPSYSNAYPGGFACLYSGAGENTLAPISFDFSLVVGGVPSGWYVLVDERTAGNGVVATSSPFYWDGSELPFDGESRMVALTPANDSTVATSSPFSYSFEAYIAPLDIGKGVRIDVTAVWLGGGLMENINSIFTTDDEVHDIYVSTTTGQFLFSTTTDIYLREGNWEIQGAISVCMTEILGVCLWYTPTGNVFNTGQLINRFVAGQSTAVGENLNNVKDAVSELFGLPQVGTTTPYAEAYCSVGNFKPMKCVYGLIVPSRQQLHEIFVAAETSIFGVPPFGYVTRFLSLLTSTTAVEPPNISYTFGSSSPLVLQGGTIEIDMWGNMMLAQDIVADDGSNKNVFDIVDPYVRMVVGFALLIMILVDLMSLDFSRLDGGRETTSEGVITSFTARDGGKVHSNVTSYRSVVNTKSKKT